MRTITQTLYTYVTCVSTTGEPDFQITETASMEGQGWILIDEREFSIDVEVVDYSAAIKQREIDALIARQERDSAKLLELTS